MRVSSSHSPSPNAASPHAPTPRPAASRPPRVASFRVSRFAFRVSAPAFTLIELLVVIAIIAILAGLTMPAIRSLTKSNDQSQATNLIRTMLSTARSIAISQHRTAGVVFFQETPAYSLPVHGNQVAMQLIVASYDQTGLASGLLGFTYYSTARQYLPEGIQLATLSDTQGAGGSGINAVEQVNYYTQTRAILFDANGQLLLRDGLAAQDPYSGIAPNNVSGTYPKAYGDWAFLNPSGKRPTPSGQQAGDAFSSPGFFLYNKSEMAAQNFTPDATGDQNRAAWLRNHSSVVIVNINTGGVLK